MIARNNIRVDPELILEFFLTIARAEFSLKVNGFVSGDETRVSANWDQFTNQIKDQMNLEKTQELKEASDFILLNPPWKQVLRNGQVMWDSNYPNNSLSDLEKVILLVRRIRNNLFHGGKHNNEVFEDTERTTHLLRSALVIIEEAISQIPDVRDSYEQAII